MVTSLSHPVDNLTKQAQGKGQFFVALFFCCSGHWAEHCPLNVTSNPIVEWPIIIVYQWANTGTWEGRVRIISVKLSSNYA